MSHAVESKDFKRYLAEARSWETDRLIASDKSRKIAYLVAAAFGVIALGAVVALALMMPLKRTELRIVRVSEATGIVDVLSEMVGSKTNYSEAVNKYFAQAYIKYREGYSRELAEEYYTTVGLMSAPAEQRRYGDSFNPKNPLSPLNVYGTGARLKIKVKSVSFIKENVALVRYVKEIERGASERPASSHWAATVVFKYSGAPMSEKDRAVNPLGFQVVEYRNDPETPGNDASTSQQAVPADAPPVTGQPVMVFPGIPATQAQPPEVASTRAVGQ